MKKLTTIKPTIPKLDTSIGSPVGTKRIRGGLLTRIRQRIMERDIYTCQICHTVTFNGEVDHVIPLVMGGLEDDSNRQWVCQACHKIKSDREAKQRDVY